MAQITFEDKVATRQIDLPRKYTITADDINEIKKAVNDLYDNPATSATFWTVDLMDTNTGTVYAPFDLTIDSLENVFADPLLNIQANDMPYTIGDPIALGTKITFTIVTQGVNNVYYTKMP